MGGAFACGSWDLGRHKIKKRERERAQSGGGWRVCGDRWLAAIYDLCLQDGLQKVPVAGQYVFISQVLSSSNWPSKFFSDI